MCIFVSEMKNYCRLAFLLVLLLPLVAFAKSSRKVWVIDAGHGGRDVGCEGSKIKEKAINLAVAKRVAELVRANISGVQVVMTRDTDRFLTLDQRAQIANNQNASLFLSIHVNAAPEAPGVKGTETYYGPMDGTSIPELESARKRNIQKSELLAWEMQKQYGLAGRPISRGVKRERYYVILYTKMPAVLTEVGFISNANDQDYMMSAAGQEEIAQCIFKGLKEYKETVEAGKEKNMLAEMRRTGGRTTKTFLKEDAPLLADNTTVAEEAPATEDSMASKTTEGQKSTNKNNTKKEASKKQAKDTKVVKQQDVVAASDTILDPSLEPELESGTLSFYVQIFASKSKFGPKDSRLKGLVDVKVMEKDGKYKYMAGATSDYKQARKNLDEIRKVFPDAFLVAFLGQRQISTADAQEMVVSNKKK